MSNIENQKYWNITTAICWIYTRSKDFLNKNAAILETGLFPNCMAEAQELVTAKKGLETVWVHGEKKKSTPDYTPAIDQLLSKLKAENNGIYAKAKRKDAKSFGVVPHEDWMSLELELYASGHSPYLKSNGELVWADILIEKKAVVKFWPEKPLESRLTSPSNDEISEIVEAIVKRYKQNNQKINRDDFHKEMNAGLKSGKLSSQNTRELFNDLDTSIKRTRGRPVAK